MTRQQVIKQLLQQQEAEKPPPERHEFEETTGDMKCARCGCSVHKRCNEQTFQAFVEGPCLDRAYVLPHEGHASHALWQKGTKVTCAHCGLSLHLDGQNRIILTGAIRKPCKGAAIGGSPPLTEYFRSQPSQANQQAPFQATEDPQPLSEARRTAPVMSQDQAHQQMAQALHLKARMEGLLPGDHIFLRSLKATSSNQSPLLCQLRRHPRSQGTTWPQISSEQGSH